MRGSLSTSRRRLMYGKHSCVRQASGMAIAIGWHDSVVTHVRTCMAAVRQPPHLHNGIVWINLHGNPATVTGASTTK